MNRIVITDLSKSFGEKHIFSDLNAVFDEGITCICGKSGCGKTTLMRIIAGLEKQTGGKIDGVSENVTFMFQETRLLPSLSALENVYIVSKKDKKQSIEKARELLSSLSFTESDLTKKQSELSGGMKQRVSLARTVLFAMHHGGNTVILDEPFKGLDNETKMLATEMIRSLKGKNILIVTHDEDDHLLVDGKNVYFNDFL